MKIKALLYCCKNGKKLVKGLDDYFLEIHSDNYYWKKGMSSPMGLNGKIVCECEVETEEIGQHRISLDNGCGYDLFYETDTLEDLELQQRSCLDTQQLSNYFMSNADNGEKVGYALHLSNVKERVMELNQVYKYDNSYNNMFGWVKEEDEKYIPIEKAPQNMQWCWVYENGKWVKYLLISIRSQWLYKILNREKTIEVRRKVLKGMCD